MFERYTEKARRVIFFARYEASQFGCPYIESEHMLLGLLREDKILSRQFMPGMSHESIRTKVEAVTTRGKKFSTSVDLPLSNECKRALAYAAEEAERLSDRHIGTEHLFLGLLREEKCLAAQFLHEAGLRISMARAKIKESGPVVRAERVDSILGGFVVNLSQRAQDRELRPFVDREKEMENLILVLGRSEKNSAVLVGEPGVGKRSLAEGLAQRMAAGNVPAFLSEKSLLDVDIARLTRERRVSNEVFMHQVAAALTHAKESVLFINDLVTIMASGQTGLAADINEIVKPLLLDGRVQCISAATPQQWEKAFTNYGWLDGCFRRIDVEPMSQAAAIEVLQSAKERHEKFHNVVYTDDALQHAVLYSSIHVKDRHLPDKALDLLDEAAAYVNAQTRLPEEVANLRKKIRSIITRMENSIANHEFEKARFYSDEERKERSQLELLLKKHNLAEGRAIEVTRAHIEEVLARWTGIPVSKIRESGTAERGGTP